MAKHLNDILKQASDIIKGVRPSTTEPLSTGTDPGVDYKPKAGDESEFIAKHSVQKWDDVNGNDDKLFNASNIKRSNNHGKTNGAAKKDEFAPRGVTEEIVQNNDLQETTKHQIMGHFTKSPSTEIHLIHGRKDKVTKKTTRDIHVVSKDGKSERILAGVNPNWDHEKIKQHLSDTHKDKFAAAGGINWKKAEDTKCNKTPGQTWCPLHEMADCSKSTTIKEKDEGKPGLNFKKIANKAAKEYGSKEAGNRVAGAIRAKILAKEESIKETYDDNSTKVSDWSDKKLKWHASDDRKHSSSHVPAWSELRRRAKTSAPAPKKTNEEAEQVDEVSSALLYRAKQAAGGINWKKTVTEEVEKLHEITIEDVPPHAKPHAKQLARLAAHVKNNGFTHQSSKKKAGGLLDTAHIETVYKGPKASEVKLQTYNHPTEPYTVAMVKGHSDKKSTCYFISHSDHNGHASVIRQHIAAGVKPKKPSIKEEALDEETFVIRHKKTRKVLSTHDTYAGAKDEHNGLSDKHEYGVYTRIKGKPKSFKTNEEVELEESTSTQLHLIHNPIRNGYHSAHKNLDSAKRIANKIEVSTGRTHHITSISATPDDKGYHKVLSHHTPDWNYTEGNRSHWKKEKGQQNDVVHNHSVKNTKIHEEVEALDELTGKGSLPAIQKHYRDERNAHSDAGEHDNAKEANKKASRAHVMDVHHKTSKGLNDVTKEILTAKGLADKYKRVKHVYKGPKFKDQTNEEVNLDEAMYLSDKHKEGTE